MSKTTTYTKIITDEETKVEFRAVEERNDEKLVNLSIFIYYKEENGKESDNILYYPVYIPFETEKAAQPFINKKGNKIFDYNSNIEFLLKQIENTDDKTFCTERELINLYEFL